MKTKEEIKAMSREELENYALATQINEEMWYQASKRVENRMKRLLLIISSAIELGKD
jgi:hypothetical protein